MNYLEPVIGSLTCTSGVVLISNDVNMIDFTATITDIETSDQSDEYASLQVLYGRRGKL